MDEFKLFYDGDELFLKLNNYIFPIISLLLIYFWYRYSELQGIDYDTQTYNSNLNKYKEANSLIFRYKQEYGSKDRRTKEAFIDRDELFDDIKYYENNSPVYKKQMMLFLISFIFIIYLICITLYVNNFNVEYVNYIILSISYYLGGLAIVSILGIMGISMAAYK